MFSFISKFLDKYVFKTGSPQAPKAFAQKKKSIFLNRYAGLIYFLVVWHAFGYVIVAGAKKKASLDGKFEF